VSRRVTHRVGDEFEERTLFFWATLGLVALLRRFGRVLAAPVGPPTLTLPSDPPPVEGHEALYAFLGVVSAARTARLHWRLVARDRDVPPAPGKKAAALARPRQLLV
jgi:hypothetical protein